MRAQEFLKKRSTENLDEGVIDFISKSKDKFLRLKDALSDEWAQTKEMWEIVQKRKTATQKEINFANSQFKDILRVAGLSAWYALPIPGNTLLILATEKILNKVGMSIIPDKIRNQVLMSKQQGVTEDSFQGIDISVEREEDEIMVRASAGGRPLGSVLFVDYDGALMPQDLEVDERYRGQGIARTMYDYVKSLGYKIRRSGQQTDAGAGFWAKHRPDSNVWESELDEVKILSKVKGKGSEPGQLPRFGRPIAPGEETRYLGTKVADWQGREIWRDYLGGQLSYHLFDPDTRTVIVTTFGSRYKNNPRSYIIHGLYAAPGNPVRAAEFYRGLVRDLGLTLISDRKQSPGGNRVWQQLEQFPDVEVYGYDTNTDQALNFGAGDVEMYTVPSAAVAGSKEMQRVARDLRLVATAR